MKINKQSSRALDRIDRAILSVLQQQGRISNVDLSQRVHLSPSPCLERVRRLEADGYIEGYSAILNAQFLGLSKVAFIQVTLDHTTEDVFDKFKVAVAESPHIVECHMVAGGFDYFIKVRFDDMDNYRQVLEQVVKLPHVSQTHTYVVIEEVKSEQGIPLALLE
ncbi:MAG: winged helix-turn-helix transcriptional regulator [Cellvibrionaceae bacterium]|nr:winged helix-turn-helix transcriptional regulator [Cellvibrionaceae bacterium]